MAVELQKAAEPSTTTSTNTNSKEFKKATVYLNVGYTVTLDNGKTFVSLPFGLGLDNMSMAKTDTSNSEYNALNEAKNQLLKDLLEVAEGIQAGNSKFINGLSLEIRKKAEAQSSEGDNPFMKRKAFEISE